MTVYAVCTLFKAIANLLRAIVEPPIRWPFNATAGRLPPADAYVFPILNNTKRMVKHCGAMAGMAHYCLRGQGSRSGNA